MAYTDINSEDRLVQATFAEHLELELGWDSVYAYNQQSFGPTGTLGRSSEREAVLVRDLREALTRLNPQLPPPAIADAVAQLSKDSSTKVGALIVGASNEVRSMGYNGSPRGCSADEGLDGRTVRPEKYFWFSHAEANAITNAARVGTPLEGSSIVVTHFPCMDCARAIVQAGIVRVVTRKPNVDFYDRWEAHIVRAKRLFNECGVEVEYVNA